MSTSAPATRQTILGLQAMRALASLAVVAFHVGLIMADSKYGAMGGMARPSAFGWLGVNFFFVLSGFIICFAHARDIGRPARIGTYLWRRFARVYPVYWVFLTLFIVAALAGFGTVNFTTDTPNLLTAYSLMRFTDAPTLPLKVAWTLFFEVFFYAMFALLILHRWLGIAGFAIWAGVIGWRSFITGTAEIDLGSAWAVNFLWGGLAYWLYRRLPARAGGPLLAGSLVLLVAVLASGWVSSDIEAQQTAPAGIVVLGGLFMGVLLGGALWEGRRGYLGGRLLLLLGEASYAIYLVHSAVISACLIVYARLAPGLLPQPVLFAGIFVAATIGGLVAHLAVERPLVVVLRRLPQGGWRALPREWLKRPGGH